jgi:tryptophan 2,3-dioxygenase
MQKPARWNGDPDCGHRVAHAYQTHYCSYIRVPKLLTLQGPAGDRPDELLALLALQACELWFKVLLADLSAALAGWRVGKPADRPARLLTRAARILALLEAQVDLAETILIRELDLRLPLASGSGGSEQFIRLEGLAAEVSQQMGRPARGALRSSHAAEQVQAAKEPSSAGPDAGRLRRAASDFVSGFERFSARFKRLLEELVDDGAPAHLDYDAHLQLSTLLALQTGVKADWTPAGKPPSGHSPTAQLTLDELLFIVVHQVFELWFRAQLGQLDAALGGLLAEPADVAGASERLRRVVAMQKLLVDMIHVPSLMLPLEFLQFRSQTRAADGLTLERGLSPASGTESYQFRELEIIAGLKLSVAYQEFLQGNRRMHIRFLTPAQEARLGQPSLPDAFRDLLQRRGVGDLLEIFAPAGSQNPHADLAELADLLLEFDQFFQLWRMNHLTMVQSMIGRKSGTGFLGPEYLKETVGMGLQGEDDRLLPTPQMRPRFFEDLWEVRTRMQANGLDGKPAGGGGGADGGG